MRSGYPRRQFIGCGLRLLEGWPFGDEETACAAVETGGAGGGGRLLRRDLDFLQAWTSQRLVFVERDPDE